MNEHARRELEPHPAALPLRRGATGALVSRVQEWLCLHGFHTAVDGDFGPATERAVHCFQWDGQHAEAPHWTPGVVTAETWAALTEPIRRVAEWKRQDWPKRSDGDAVVDCARAHLAAHPREVGGPNAGPWVRYYCRGQEVPWCAGFATTVLGQALGHDDWYTLSCDALALMAAQRSLLTSGADPRTRAKVRPGDLFLIRNPGLSMVDWTHTGIVTAVGDGYFQTIEGNTNTNGAREGTAVHERTRAFSANVDFVLTGGDRT